MAVYLVTSIFETEPGQFKKYTMAYDSLDAALEYVELDMGAQYDGIYAEVLTDDVKELIRMRGDFYFKYGEMPHYIMIERLEILSALPENVDNVVRFSLSEHMIEPLEGDALAADAEEEAEEEAIEEMENGTAEEDVLENITKDEENAIVEPPVEEENGLEEDGEEGEEEESEAVLEENTIDVNSGETSDVPSINGLNDEEAPLPETIPIDNSESTSDVNMEFNMGSNISSTEEQNNSSMSASEEPMVAQSNIPAALQTSTGGKRRTRRKGGKGKRATRKV